jgi:hypothetical protein
LAGLPSGHAPGSGTGTRRLTDIHYAEAVAELGEPQLIELVALAGHYSLIGLTLGAFEVPQPDDLPADYTF